MQRTRDELDDMSRDELSERILEMQDILKESLLVREAMQKLLNRLLTVKEPEVGHYASANPAELSHEEREIREAWAKARHAVANPAGLVERQD